MERDPHYDCFEPGVSTLCAGYAYHFFEPERSLEIWAEGLSQQGWARNSSLSMYMWTLPVVGRAAEARAMAGEAFRIARQVGQPMSLAISLGGCGRAFTQTEPDRALAAFREGLAIARQHRVQLVEFAVMREAAALETLRGDRQTGLDLFDAAIDGFHRAGNQVSLSLAFASLAVVLDHLDQPDAAATLYGVASPRDSLAVPDRTSPPGSMA